MALFDVHPWMRFTAGLVAGCWIGVAVGCVLPLILAGRRLRQLESANLLLRLQLRTRERAKRRSAAAAGSAMEAHPPSGMNPPAAGSMGRFAASGQ